MNSTGFSETLINIYQTIRRYIVASAMGTANLTQFIITVRIGIGWTDCYVTL
jgi:hypothetical protein